MAKIRTVTLSQLPIIDGENLNDLTRVPILDSRNNTNKTVEIKEIRDYFNYVNVGKVEEFIKNSPTVEGYTLLSGGLLNIAEYRDLYNFLQRSSTTTAAPLSTTISTFRIPRILHSNTALEYRINHGRKYNPSIFNQFQPSLNNTYQTNLNNTGGNISIFTQSFSANVLFPAGVYSINTVGSVNFPSPVTGHLFGGNTTLSGSLNFFSRSGTEGDRHAISKLGNYSWQYLNSIGGITNFDGINNLSPLFRSVSGVLEAGTGALPLTSHPTHLPFSLVTAVNYNQRFNYPSNSRITVVMPALSSVTVNANKYVWCSFLVRSREDDYVNFVSLSSKTADSLTSPSMSGILLSPSVRSLRDLRPYTSLTINPTLCAGLSNPALSASTIANFNLSGAADSLVNGHRHKPPFGISPILLNNKWGYLWTDGQFRWAIQYSIAQEVMRTGSYPPQLASEIKTYKDKWNAPFLNTSYEFVTSLSAKYAFTSERIRLVEFEEIIPTTFKIGDDNNSYVTLNIPARNVPYLTVVSYYVKES